MLSGKPPRPWKKSRRRRISVVRIMLYVVILGAAGTYALWHARPQPPVLHAVGSEVVATPSFDIAEERNRRVWQRLARRYDDFVDYGPGLAQSCGIERSPSAETYVLTRFPPFPSAATPVVRTTVRLDRGGEVMTERIDPPVSARSLHGLTETGAEAFRALLVDGGFPRMGSRIADGICDGEILHLESCVRGRYFAVVRECETLEDSPVLAPLAARIEAFAE